MRCAVFDWDNTVCSGYALFGFAEYLAEGGFISTQEFDEVVSTQAGYRAGRYSHDDFARIACDTFSAILVGKDPHMMKEMAQRFVADGYRCSLFEYVRPVLGLLKRNRVRALVISGAPAVVIHPLAMSIGFSGIWGYSPEVVRGGRAFSGRTFCNYGTDKMSAMRYIMKRYGRPLVGFGDSTSDAPLLQCAIHGFIVGDAKLSGVKAARISSHMQTSEVVRMVSKALRGRSVGERSYKTDVVRKSRVRF